MICIPVWEKVCLTIDEAMAYSGIGEKSLRSAMKDPLCPFCFYVGNKTLIKRKEFEKFISSHNEL